ncbi:MAG: TolC family protein [Treponema sp.]|jgi:outer membrane protein TolC|nr:TolC family protein [Treponema sp.]
MNIKKRTIPLFILVTGFLYAQDIRLTLEDACVLAEQNSIALQKQAVDLEFDRIKAKSLWAQVFPTINVSGGARYSIPLNSDAPKTDPSYTATLNLRLGLSAGLPLTMTNISLAYKNNLLNYEQARRVLVNQTAKTFYSLLAQKDRLQVLEGTMRLAAEQLARNRIARQSGYIGELDFLSTQVGAERARLNHSRALTDYQNALGKFLAALGLDPNKPVILVGDSGITKLSLNSEVLIHERLALRPDIIYQRNEIERLKNTRAETFLSSKAPSVDLFASWGASAKSGFDDMLSAGISVTIPIDPWVPRTRTDQAVKRSDGEYQKAQLELISMEDNARQEIQSYTDSIGNTWTEVEIARLQAGYAQRAFELAEQFYRRGTMSYLDFEAVRNRLDDARQQQFQSELAYKILVLDLASSLNMEEGELKNYSR